MRAGSITLAILLLGACSSIKTIDNDQRFSHIESEATAQWEKHKDTQTYENFVKKWLSFNNATDLDKKRRCDKISSEDQTLILVQNIEGKIETVVFEERNEETICFKKVFLDKVYPKPPFAPFYHYMRIQNR